MANLTTNAMGVEFKNPIITASGTFGFGEEFSQIFDLSILGGICSKGLTLHPKQGNKGVRLWETPMGLINSIGLQNPGVDKFICDELPKMKSYGTKVIANLGGNTTEEYIIGAKKLSVTDVDIIELNISCPNVKSGGMAFGIKSNVAFDIVSSVKKVCKKPLMVKLSPNAENIADMALACESGGADAISLINTIKAMAIDVKKKTSVFDNIYAGLSGPCVKPIALRMVHEVSKVVKVPVCGLGGIMTSTDVIEFIMAGATIVQIGTGNFIKPDIAVDIIDEINEYMDKENIKTLDEIRGII
ncbi:MAG: dihydroorotate dehydrogenase [Tissierellia bacterium]|nr:dihydroorotate dehydrogenase [Tissierellia bacterium]MDD4780008.1 dihydroorotate dehydrogenase [Tissierellia bacterium]